MEPKMTDPFDMSSQVENGEQSRGRFLDTHHTRLFKTIWNVKLCGIYTSCVLLRSGAHQWCHIRVRHRQKCPNPTILQCINAHKKLQLPERFYLVKQLDSPPHAVVPAVIQT